MLLQLLLWIITSRYCRLNDRLQLPNNLIHIVPRLRQYSNAFDDATFHIAFQPLKFLCGQILQCTCIQGGYRRHRAWLRSSQVLRQEWNKLRHRNKLGLDKVFGIKLNNIGRTV